MRSVKHEGFGRYRVVEDGQPISEPFTGTGAKERAEALAREGLPAKAKKLSALDGDRAYWAKVEADLGQPVQAEMAEHEAVFRKYHDPDTVRRLMAVLDPEVKRGSQGGRRRHIVLPKKAA